MNRANLILPNEERSLGSLMWRCRPRMASPMAGGLGGAASRCVRGGALAFRRLGQGASRITRRFAPLLVLVMVLATAGSALSSLPSLAADGAMPEGNRSRGIKIFKQCRTCHSVRPDEHNTFGPNLYGVIGRQVAAVEGYEYSEALKKAGFAWSVERLDAYLKDPKGYLPGARMNFKGLADAQARADVIAYIAEASKRN